MTDYDITDVNLLHYFGSKFKALNALIPYFPIFHGIDMVYYDFFMGSLIIPFKLNPRCVVLNDINHDIFNFWNVIKLKRKEYEEEMRYVFIGQDWFDEYHKRTDDIGRAVFTYIQYYIGRGIPTEKFKNYSTCYPLIKHVDAWENWFNNKYSLVIWNKDFRDAFKQVENYNNRIQHVIYCDPPFKKQGRNYKHPFTEKDHKDLRSCLELLRNNPTILILISYDDDLFIRDLYSDWYIINVNWKVGAGKTRSIEQYHELLISNRPLMKQILSDSNLGKFGVSVKK